MYRRLNQQNINRKFVRILTISAEKLSAECLLLEEVLLYKLQYQQKAFSQEPILQKLLFFVRC
jgi:hypothetical protein